MNYKAITCVGLLLFGTSLFAANQHSLNSFTCKKLQSFVKTHKSIKLVDAYGSTIRVFARTPQCTDDQEATNAYVDTHDVSDCKIGYQCVWEASSSDDYDYSYDPSYDGGPSNCVTSEYSGNCVTSGGYGGVPSGYVTSDWRSHQEQRDRD